jgi:hypothetical protein
MSDRPDSRRPPPWLACAALGLGSAFALWRGSSLWPAIGGAQTPWSVRLICACQLLAEVVFAFGIAGMTAMAIAYLLLPARRRLAVRTSGESPRIAILYLCCGDLDHDAVASLRRLRWGGALEFWIHDDLPGGDPLVDALAERCAQDGLVPVRVLRRPDKHGGKPGAINHVLDHLAGRTDFVLLCDNDSIALDDGCLALLLEPMSDPRVAVVQARNAPVVDDSVCTLNRVASQAIAVFHLFLQVGSRLAWTPFVGHNALLRLDAVRRVGGLQPGCFADDIDLTLRLQLAGYRVHYAGEVPFGERHPPSYAAFRKRSYKWACGSVQVLRRWLVPVLCSRQLRLAEKWGFVQFLGFYALQGLALVYTALAFLVAPFVLSREWFPATATIVAGTALPLLIFLPVLAFAVRQRWWRRLPQFLVACWLCYGATDFPTARGALHGLGRRMRRWVPTNSVRGGVDRSMFGEALFGAAILLVPLCRFPELLLSPLTFLVAVKFLLLPTIGELYQDGVRARPRAARAAVLPQLLRITGTLFLAGTLLGQDRPSDGPASVTVRGDQLLVDGRPYIVRGVHYGPWRPGTGPGKSPYPARALLEEDLDLVAEMHANTIFTFDPPRELLDVAWARGVRVLCGFWFDWEHYGQPSFGAAEDAAVAAVAGMRDHPAVLGWVVGNEVPADLVVRETAAGIEGHLRGLHARIVAVDHGHPVTHANWPNARSLDLSFFEICSFNVYALWPPEVVARGYGNFVRDVLRPIAAGRPLLITEFGANALEATADGQARLDRECWLGLRQAGAIGGFAFEFADEWWKNYSNPRIQGAYWDRAMDPDDHLRHDEDPEEYYGLFDGERHPRPARDAIALLYASDGPIDASADAAVHRGTGSKLGLLVAGTIAGAGVLFLFTARMRARHRAEARALRADPSASGGT